MTETLFVKNMFGVKGYFDVNVLAKTEDEKVIIVKTWDGYFKKLKLNEKENCYEVKDEMKEKKVKKNGKNIIYSTVSSTNEISRILD